MEPWLWKVKKMAFGPFFLLLLVPLCKNQDIFFFIEKKKIWKRTRSLELLRTLFKKSVIDSTVQLIICV